MTQLSPTSTNLIQTVGLLNQFKKDYADGKFQDPQEISEEFRSILTKLNNDMFSPMTEYEALVEGEPPSSLKMNRFWQGIQLDINTAEDQLMNNEAAILFMHNFVSSEILKAQSLNSKLANKLKTLQMYSSSHDKMTSFFGDYFRNLDFIDSALVPSAKACSFDIPGQITLGRTTIVKNGSKLATVKILSSSNGFLGNNQEIVDPSTATTNPVDNAKIYKFVTETNRRAVLSEVVDNQPNTWIEYEAYKVTDADKLKAKNFNFSYLENIDLGVNGVTDITAGTRRLDWASGPTANVLKLDLEFDLTEIKKINNVTYTPFGLESNKNFPVKVTKVQISEDSTDWIVLNPENVWIGTDVNIKTASAADNVSINAANWSFEPKNVRYLRISIEQNTSIDCNIGHIYYETKGTTTRTTTEVADPTSPTGKKLVTNTVVTPGERKEGPIPPVTNPGRYLKTSNLSIKDGLVQKSEYFKGKRWAIGVRDILFQEVQYKESGTTVSTPFKVGGIIDRVSIEADVKIPDEFDDTDTWVKFYVSPNDGVNWYQISRVQDDFLGIPEIIAFNDPIPEAFRDPGVAYYNVDGSVDKVRVKIELKRPTADISSSPVVKWYKLKIRKR